MSFSMNDIERKAAQGLVDLKNYCHKSSIWAHKLTNHLITNHQNMTTFTYSKPVEDVFLFPLPSPNSYYPTTTPSPVQIHDKGENIYSSGTEESKSKKKKPKLSRKKSRRKPRWNKDLRNSLSLAIIDQKRLSDAASFDWRAIGRKTGKSGKACKRQWLDEILPNIQSSYKH